MLGYGAELPKRRCAHVFGACASRVREAVGDPTGTSSRKQFCANAVFLLLQASLENAFCTKPVSAQVAARVAPFTFVDLATFVPSWFPAAAGAAAAGAGAGSPC